MSLLAPVWLAVGALTVFVLILHMQRRRHLDVPSVMLWRLLENNVARRRSLRLPTPNVLMLLQIAAVILIAIALAQPLLGPSRGSEHTIYVVDASASMRATDLKPSRFEDAVTRLTGMIEASAPVPGNRVSVVFAGATAQLVVARQAASAAVHAADGMRAGDGPADWKGAADLVAPLVRGGEPTEIVVLTDGADAGAKIFAEVFPAVHSTQTLVAGPDATNVGLTARAVPVKAETGKWRFVGAVRFGGAKPDRVEVRALFQPEGQEAFIQLATTEVVRRSGDTEETFTMQMDVPGPGALTLQLPADAGPADNEVNFVLRNKPAVAYVLYVGEPNHQLISALQSIQNVVVTAADTLPVDDDIYDLVIADGVALSRRPNTNVLWLRDAYIAGQTKPVALKESYVTGWNADHVLARGVDWTAIAAQTAYRVARMPGAAVLAETGGFPLVQARTTPRGREVQLAFELKDSEWTDRTGFPVFITNLVHWLGVEPGAVAEAVCTVGVPCPIESRLITGRMLSPDGLEVWTGASRTAEFLLPGVELGFVPDRAGFYRIEGKNESHLVPVNAVVEGETALAALDPAAAAAEETKPTVPVWNWLLVAALAVLLVEAWIAGRGPEQFLRRTGLASTNPLAVRRRLQLAVRAAASALLVAAIVGMPVLLREPAQQVVVVLATDLGPESKNTDRDRVLKQVQANLNAGGAHAGLVTTGAFNTIAADAGVNAVATGGVTKVAPAGTNLEQAVRLAAAMVPVHRAGRVVLATDGNETAGDISRSIGLLRARGLTVDIQPLTELPPGEVLVESIRAPSRVFAGDTFLLDAVIYSQGTTKARVTIKRAGVPSLDEEVDLVPGRNRVESVIPAGDAGDLLLEVSAKSDRDTFAQNNTDGLFVEVAATPTIAIITDEIDMGDYFAHALAVQGLTATVVRPSKVPTKMEGWMKYDSVVLMNMPAIAMDTEQQEQLEKLVQVYGRGLLILGGENSFGPGGYFETPFERLSPLSAKVAHEAPRIAMVFVLDRSGSMIGAVDTTGIITRLDIAKQATLSAVSLLNDESQVGIVVFDSEGYILLALQDHKDEAGIRDALRPLVPGGGTSIFPGLQLGIDMIATSDASTKHIVVMTDGLSQDADFGALLDKARKLGITVSAIAIGSSADVRQPQDIAQRGGGAFYATEDFKALPSILAQETLMLTTSPVKDRTAQVAWADRSADFLSGMPQTMPPVHGYVRTTAQPAADVHMTVTEEDGEITPLLASWRYGNGHVLSFATHGAGAGTQEWTHLAEYPLMWAQAIRQFLGDTPGPGLTVALHRTGDTIEVAADLLDKDGAPLVGHMVLANFGDAPGTSVSLSESSPGHYQGVFAATQTGSYVVEVKADDLSRSASVYVGYPARYDFVRSDFDKLQAVAAATGGKLLLGDKPVFDDARHWVAQPEWRLWTALALILFMLDLAIRHAPGLFGLNRRSSGLVPSA